MEPRFAAIADVHNCPSCRASWVASFPQEEQPKAREAMKLYDEAIEQLRLWADETLCHGLFLLADARSEGDDIIIDNKVRIPFLRQQHMGRSGYTLCLSDFIREGHSEQNSKDIANTIGVFATTVNLPSEAQSSTFDFQFSTLSDRLAEATAEKMHEEIRKHHWGYAKDEQLTMQELHAEKFQGIRPAVGYPSLPDQSINFILDDLLDMKQIGITLTENGMMQPHASVSGMIFAHPASRYFSVGKIDETQLEDYARRRNLPLETMKKYLSSNL